MDPAVEFNKEIKRRIVNRELMMLHGCNVTSHLPPLPREERPKTALGVSPWLYDNPAMRQLSSAKRRGPRAKLSLSLSVWPSRSGTPYSRSTSASWASMPRSHTSEYSIPTFMTEPYTVHDRPYTAMTERQSLLTETHSMTERLKTVTERPTSMTERPYTSMTERSYTSPTEKSQDMTTAAVAGSHKTRWRRPCTAHSEYTAHVRSVLNTTIAQEEKTMTMADFEKSQTYKRLAPPEDLEKLITPAKVLQNAGEVDDDEYPDFLISSVAPGGSVQRKPLPQSVKAAMRSKSKKKGSRKETSGLEDAKRKEQMIKVLRGDWDKLPREVPCTVRIYLCANTQDMAAERQVLFKYAFPELQEFCRHRGLDFHVVDVRWGAGPSVDTELITTGLHIKEIHTCQRLSLGPCFVNVLGDRYGEPVCPYRINKEEFESLKEIVEEHHISKGYLLDEWYQMDENVIPNTYTLQLEPTGNSYKGKTVKAMCMGSRDTVAQMHTDTLAVLQECVELAVEQGKVKSDKKHKYFKSVIEEEITYGLLDSESPTEHCFCYIREFTDLPSALDDTTRIYLDMTNRSRKAQVDDDARRRLEALKHRVKHRIPHNVRTYNASLKDYTDDTVNYQKGSYLHRFCEDFIRDMKALIDNDSGCLEVTKLKNYNIYKEVLQHAKVANQKASLLVGRKDTIAVIENYVTGNSTQPFVLHGIQGSGKSTIMGKVCRLATDWLGESAIVIARFLGAILETRSLISLLTSLCSQLSVAYNLDPPSKHVMTNCDKLVHAFHQMLEQASKWHGAEKPLLLLLDALSDIEPEFRAHTLYWIPFQLPSHVHVILSVEPAKYGMLDRLQVQIPEANFLGIYDLDEETVKDIFVRSLQKRNRQLTSDQRDLMLRLTKNHPKPLYTYLTTTEALTWASYTEVPESRIPAILEDFIWRHLVRTENKYGHVLVEHMFSYLAVSPYGLTEVELRDALSCNDEVMRQVFSDRMDLSNHEVAMPSFLLCRLLNEVRPLLTERSIEDRTAIMFNHRIMQQVCSRKYFGHDYMFSEESEGVDRVCKALCEVFIQEKGVRKTFYQDDSDSNGISANRYVTPLPLEPSNKRKLRMLPYLVLNSGTYYEVRDSLKKQTFCNFMWLFCALQSLKYDAVLAMFKAIKQKDSDLDLLKDFLQLCKVPLLENVTSLATHLLGCTPRLSDSFKFVNELLKQAASWLESSSNPAFVPSLPCLPSCYDMCKITLWGLTDLLKLADHHLAVMRNKDNIIEIWDLVECECVFSTGVHFDKLAPNVFCTSTRLFTIDGESMKIWQIDSGITTYELNVSSLLGENVNSLLTLAVSENFHLVAVHSSDDDFNQCVTIVNTETNDVTNIKDFDVKDDFFKQSALLADNENILVFAKSRSENTEDSARSVVYLNLYSLQEKKYKRIIHCGEKKFHSLVKRDEESVIVCWADASFDMFDVRQGSHICDMPAPGNQLTLHTLRVAQDRNIIFLATRYSESSNSSQFSALWKWDIEDEDTTRLVLIDHDQDNHYPTNFHMAEDEQFAIISSAKGRKVSLWDTTKEKHIRSIMTHTSELSNMVACSDPFMVYTCSQEECAIKLWNLHRLLPRNLPPKSYITPMSILINKESDMRVRRPARASSRKRASSVHSSKSVRFADEVPDDDAASVASGSTRRGELVSCKDIEDLDLMHMESVSDDVDIWDFKQEMDAIFGVTCTVISKDSYYVVTGSEDSLPRVWFTSDGHIRHTMEPHSPEDLGTAWLELGNNDNYIVALVTTETTRRTYPYYYLFRIWELDTADAVQELGNVYATACSLSCDKERAVIATVDEFDPTMETYWVLFFRVIYLAELKTETEISFRTQTCPTHLQLTEDDKYCITDHVVDPHEGSTAIRSFSLHGSGFQQVDTLTYKFKKGKKYEEYKATKNLVLRNGLAVAVGLNGDMQLWDIQTCEYEGNLYEDASVRDKRNPALHNHGGMMINHLVLSKDGRYLLVSAEDCSVSLWDIEDEVMLHSYTGHTDQVKCACISEDNELIITAGNDLQLLVYKFGTNKVIYKLYIHVQPTALTLSADKSYLAVLAHRRNELSRFMLFRLLNLQ